MDRITLPSHASDEDTYTEAGETKFNLEYNKHNRATIKVIGRPLPLTVGNHIDNGIISTPEYQKYHT